MARNRNMYEEKIRLGVVTSGDEELSKLARTLATVGDSSEESATQAQQLVDELAKLASTSNDIKQFTKLKASVAETGEALVKAKERLAALGAEADQAERPTAKLQAALKRAAGEVENLSKQQNRQQVALQRTSGSLRAAGVDTDKLGDAYQRLEDEFREFGQRAGTAADAMRRTAKDGKSAAGGVESLGKAAAVSKKSLAAIAAQLMIVSGAATAAIKGLAAISGATLFTGAIRSATTLEDALAQVQAVSGASADEMERLKAAAEAGGASTRFSALEAAQGLGELARATGSAQTAIAALPATLNLAQAAGLGVSESAQLITTTLTQYGLAADQAARVSDVLADAANSTTADVQGLGNALSYAAPLANQLGLDVEKTTAIVGALADEGFRGERAGTALRNVFSEMLDPASEFGKALRELGIESTDFVEVIDQLASKGQRGRDALLKLDAAARPAIMALVNRGGAGLRQLDEDLRNVAGAAEETALQMGDTLGGAFEAIGESFDQTRRSLVEPLLEPLKNELLVLAGELEKFAASPEFAEIKVALTSLFAEGAEAARDLIEEVDYAELAKRIKSAIGDASATLTEFKENLGEIVATVVAVGRGFELAFNTVQAAVLLLASAVSKVVSLMVQLADGLTGPQQRLLQFFGLLPQGTSALQEFAGGMGAVSEEFAGRFAKNAHEAVDAAQRLAGAGAAAGEATAAALTHATDASGGAVEALVSVTDAANDSAEALTGQAAAVDASAAATEAAATSMEADGARLKQAFADMGITAQVDLNRAAEAAKSNFHLIRQAVNEGRATADDARRAFAAYASAARAAVADSDESTRARVEAELQVTAAVLGVGDALDSMASRGVAAGQQVASGANVAREALERLAGAGADAGDGADRADKGIQRVGKGSGTAGDKVKGMSVELTGLTDELAKAYVGMNRYATDAGMFARNISLVSAAWREQEAAVSRLNEGLDEQLARLDPLAERLEDLKGQYPFVEEAKLRATAEKQQRLEDEATRRRDEAQQLRDEAQAAREQASQAAGVGAGEREDRRVGSASSPVAGALPVGGRLHTIRIEDASSGQAVDLLATEGADEALAAMLGRLGRAGAITTRRRR